METHSLLWFPLKFHKPGPTRTNVGPGDEARGTRHQQLIIVITKPLVCLAFELLLTEILHTIQLPGVTRSVSSCLPTNSLQLYRGGGGGGGGGEGPCQLACMEPILCSTKVILAGSSQVHMLVTPTTRHAYWRG